MTDIAAAASLPISTTTAAPGTAAKPGATAATGKADGAVDPFTALLASLAPASDTDAATPATTATVAPVAIPVPTVATPKVPALPAPTEEPVVAEHEGDDTGEAPKDGDGKDTDQGEDPALAMMLALAPPPAAALPIVQPVITPLTANAATPNETAASAATGAVVGTAERGTATQAQDGKAPDADADVAAGDQAAVAPQTDARSSRFASLAARLFASASPTTATSTDTAQPLPTADVAKQAAAKLQPQLATMREAAPREAVAATAAPATPDVAVTRPKTRTAATDPLAAIFAAPAAPAAAPLQDTGTTTANAAPAGDATVTRELSVARDGQWLDTLARDIAATAGKDGQLSFRLDPQHLGSLTVHISHSAEGASIRMTADTESGRAMLADAQPRLAAEARAQGLTLRDTSVDMGGSGAGSSGQQGQSFANLAQGQSQQQRNPAPGQTFVNLNARQGEEAANGPEADARSDLYA